jgi:hypothetical protein
MGADTGEGASAFTSSIPPPDVISCFSLAFRPHRDHLLLDAGVSCIAAISAGGASGSPSFDLLSHGAADGPRASLFLDRRVVGA